MSEILEIPPSPVPSGYASGTNGLRMGSIEGSSSKVSKSNFSFMEKRQTYRVIVEGVDLTPENIVDPDYITMEDTYTHAVFEIKHWVRSEFVMAKKSKKKSKSRTDRGMKMYATAISLDDIYIDHTCSTEERFVADEDLEIAPSAFQLPKSTRVMSYPPEVFIVLKETETHFLFELPSFCYEKGTSEGNSVEEENEYYQYITVGKGRNRKMVAEETQTKQYVTQTRQTLAIKPQKKNATAFASLWDMHDTYARLAEVKAKEEPDEMVLYQSAAPNLLRKKNTTTSESGKERKGKTFEEIAKTQQFFDAALLIERVLSTLQFAGAQKKFRGLVRVNPLSLDLVYTYSMQPLWTLECEETINRPITGISFNPKNPNILAVGHGKFGFAEQHKGIVCVWCTKNPCKPERLYNFEDPITSVAFSKNKPNWLACGFANGDVLILDITSYTTKIVAKSKRETNPCFEPIWVTHWCVMETLNEYVMTACQDGRINRFKSTKTHDFICSTMMRISAVEGKVKCLETTRPSLKVDVPITRYPAALCMKWHPTIEHIYFIGTEEGCIHKCSAHYLNQHIEVFRAHAGPIYDIEFSPYMSSLLVSCGADGAIRIWLEQIDDVIMTLTCPAAVYGIAFCPINATILLSVSGNVLSIWDLRRKTHIPCAEYTFPSHIVLSYVKFSASGDNVFVGDSVGRVHTFHLEDTPLPPFYQRKMLDEAIKKALCTRPQILRQLEKLEKFRERIT